GSQVRIETIGTVIKGLDVDVDETGALIVEDKTGEIKKIIYGDCFHT
ncbi:MAG: biotin--[acetyl-CoA-carboxylase] ligase, partial [Desulfobacula sp.]|nr:biotin--[acetyl-CoA-carboxylase] ligase [Desulfobacula sp.]